MGTIYQDTFNVTNGPIDKDARSALGLSPTRWENIPGAAPGGLAEIESAQVVGRVKRAGVPNAARFYGQKTGANDPDFEPDSQNPGLKDFRVDIIARTEAGALEQTWRSSPVINFVDDSNFLTLAILSAGNGEVSVNLVVKIGGEQTNSVATQLVAEPVQPTRVGLAAAGSVIRAFLDDVLVLEFPYSAMPFGPGGEDPVAVFLGPQGRRAGLTIGPDLGAGGEGPRIDEWSLTTTLAVPGRPEIVAASEQAFRARCRLQSTPFSAPAFDVIHVQSEWVVVNGADPNFNNPVWYSTPGEGRRFLTVAEAGAIADGDDRPGLIPGQTYKSRVRYIDSQGGRTDWSNPFLFQVPSVDGSGQMPLIPLRTDVDVGDVYPTVIGCDGGNVFLPVYPDGFKEGLIRPASGVHNDDQSIEVMRAADWRVSEGNTEGAAKRVFELVYRDLDRSLANLLWDFYWAKRGPWKSFDFIHPHTNAAIRCRFLDNVLTRTMFEGMLQSTGVRLLEVT